MNYTVNQELSLTSPDKTAMGVYRITKLHPLSLTLVRVAGMSVIPVGKPVQKTKVQARLWKP